MKTTLEVTFTPAMLVTRKKLMDKRERRLVGRDYTPVGFAPRDAFHAEDATSNHIR